jgi:ferrous iron transport protein B
MTGSQQNYSRKIIVGLIGNPNCGKTTLFNALTGSHQQVGNWPRVTVERKSGFFEFAEHHIEVIDLPGIYSLSVANQEGSLDERIAAEYLLSSEANIIVNVIDASNLERNLYLTTQLLELNIPVVVVINMLDIAKRRGITINLEALANILQCKVVSLVANKKEGLDELKKTIIAADIFSKNDKSKIIIYPREITEALISLVKESHTPYSYFIALRLLEGDVLVRQIVTPQMLSLAEQYKKTVKEALKEDIDILISDARYGTIHKLVKETVTKNSANKTTITAFIDRIVLNRILGLPIFFFIMYLMFFGAIKIGGIFQNFFQVTSDAIFVHAFANQMASMNFPSWLMDILAFGLGRGINTIVTFIPVLTMMFFILAILESSGYMSRAGFVIDRLMRLIGLPGKSFVPMLIGFGCNVPAIMAARTLETQRDRILTIMMCPFMSCGARLAIYAVFTAAFFPRGAYNIVFLLYIIGIIVAILTGWVLRKTILPGENSFLIAELPVYHMPNLLSVLIQTWRRLKGFLLKAGSIIIPFCVILSALNTIEISTNKPSETTSLLEIVGKKATLLFAPMGISQDNWSATIGLMSGIASKEIVVASLNTLYTKEDNIISTKINSSHPPVIYGKMFEKFSRPVGAFAYLLFVLLYFPCISAVAAMFRELNWKWASFSVLWNTSIAYGVAVIFYQLATFIEHPLYAVNSIAIVIAVFIIAILLMRRYSDNKGEII